MFMFCQKTLNDSSSFQFFCPDRTPSLWPNFGFPEGFWSHALSSFHLGDKCIFGRFDMAVTSEGIKCFEYNSDSGSCIIECCLIQGKWSDALRIGGIDAGIGSENRLISVMKDLELGSQTLLHLLHDSDPEENSHARYVMGCAERAGIRCKEVTGVDTLRFDEETVCFASFLPGCFWQTNIFQHFSHRA